MKAFSMASVLMVLGCAAAATTQQGCGLLQPGPNGEPAPIQQFAGAVAPLLPGPWGAAIAAGATALVGVGSIFAKRSVNKTFTATGSDVTANPLVKGLAERKFLIPALGAIPLIGSALNLWDANMEASIGTALLSAFAVVADLLEKKPTATPPAPPTP